MTTCSHCGCELQDPSVSCPSCGGVQDDPMLALIGTTVLGVYEIVSVLGQGGMSVVYRGRHRLTDQQVALKLLPPELAAHASIRARFLEEAKALARLEHPNIVRLYHFGEEAGHFILAMQLVEGEDFEQQILRQERLPWREAVATVRQVLLALEYAHGKGIIHRDIKPSNVLVRPDGTALVMDFGIAKMGQGSSKLTEAGQTMGTVRYMSPEQVRGQQVSPATDLYSLGVALWEALAGTMPFEGETHFDIMMKHLSEPAPSLLDLVPGLPPELDRIVQQAMAKPPEARFADARAFITALDAVVAAEDAPGRSSAPTLTATPAIDPALPRPSLMAYSATIAARSSEPTLGVIRPPADMPPVAPPSTRPRRIGLWVALAAALTVGAAGLTVFALSRGGADRTEPRQDAENAPGGSGPTASWPEPNLVQGFTAAVDRRFDDATNVRVLASRPIDADHLARATVAARGRFVDYLGRRNVGRTVEVGPLNLVIAPPTIMCAPALYAPGPVAPGCATRRFGLLAPSRTLYVLDDADLEPRNLPEGVAWFLCKTTPGLVELGCPGLLTPFFDEIEKP